MPVARAARKLLCSNTRNEGKRRTWRFHGIHLIFKIAAAERHHADGYKKNNALIFKTCIYQTACGNICDDSSPVNTTVTLADVSGTRANRPGAPSR